MTRISPLHWRGLGSSLLASMVEEGQRVLGWTEYSSCTIFRKYISLGWLEDHIVSDYVKGYSRPLSNFMVSALKERWFGNAGQITHWSEMDSIFMEEARIPRVQF